MIKDVKNKKLIELFKNDVSPIRFVIPEYQREYSWEKQQISEFITDIFESYEKYCEKKEYSYFFGAIITEDKQNNEFDLIDGQQRITTFILFITVLHHIFQDSIKSTLPQEVLNNKTLIRLTTQFDGILWADPNNTENRKPKLYSKKPEDSIKLERVLNGKILEQDEDKNIFYTNYKLLEKEFNSLKSGRENFNLYDFIHFVFSSIELVQVDTTSREAALKIFSVLNTRGLDLNSTDIIKAEAMADIPQEKHKDFHAIWKRLEDLCNKNDTKLETIFTYYITMYKPASVDGTNNENIKKIWDKKDKFEALADFEDFLRNYLYILNIKDANIWCLRHLLIMGKNAYTWIPLLVAMKYNKYSDKDILDTAKFVLKWFWLYIINELTVEKIKSFVFSIIKSVNSNKSINEIYKISPNIILKEERTLDTLSQEMCNKLRLESFYGNKWTRPFLFFLHNSVILPKGSDTNEFSFLKIGGNQTIEHIYPQNIEDEAWIKCSEKFKNKLGNLTLLSRGENSAVQGDIKKKIATYKSSLYSYMPTISKEDPWNDQKITDRTESLIKDFCALLDINYYSV